MALEILKQIHPIAEKKVKVVVAMSGGVDSSTVAALLAAAGHEVIGITLQLYDYGLAVGKKGACCAGQDIYDAQIAAEKIGIPHYVLNYESIFKNAVINDFVDGYLRGETPIPCIRCNQKVKFNDLFKVAKDLEADCLATGHYVQRIIKNNKAELHSGAEKNKDQSYFLFTTTQEQLNYLRFPLGNLTKSQTRSLAHHFGLEIADKPDSQDICFVPNGSYAAVIEKLKPGSLDAGNIVDMHGKILGKHNGVINFTIGQRKGIGIASSKPLYVLKIKPESKEVVVGFKEDLGVSRLNINEVNWLGDGEFAKEEVSCFVKLRSMHKPIEATVQALENSRAAVILKEPYDSITPGQACVMYDGPRVLGGGWIERSS